MYLQNGPRRQPCGASRSCNVAHSRWAVELDIQLLVSDVNPEYALRKRLGDYVLYNADDCRSLNENTIEDDHKIAITMPDWLGCGPTVNVVLFCKDKFDKSWWILHKFVIRRFGVIYFSDTMLFTEFGYVQTCFALQHGR